MRVREADYLIRHDHDPAVAQAPQRLWVVIALLVLEADDFDDVVYLSVFHDLLTQKVKTPSARLQRLLSVLCHVRSSSLTMQFFESL